LQMAGPSFCRAGGQRARALLPASRSPPADRLRARALASHGRLLADRAAGLAREPLVDAGAVEAGVPARQPAQHCARHQLLRARAQRLSKWHAGTQGVRGVHAAPRTAARAVHSQTLATSNRRRWSHSAHH